MKTLLLTLLIMLPVTMAQAQEVSAPLQDLLNGMEATEMNGNDDCSNETLPADERELFCKIDALIWEFAEKNHICQQGDFGPWERNPECWTDVDN